MDIRKRSIASQAKHDAEMKDHLDRVRARIDSEDLSILELKLKYKELLNEANDDELDDEARSLAQAESEMVADMVGEVSLPEPNAEEMVGLLRENGNSIAAEQLAHTLAVQAKQEIVDAAREAVDDAVANNWGEAYVHREQVKLDNAVADLKEMSNPYFQRQAEADRLVQEANSKIAAGSALQATMDADVKQTAEELINTGHSVMDEATKLRNFVPTGGEAA